MGKIDVRLTRFRRRRRVVDQGRRAGLEEYSDEEDTSVDENSSSTMYLQLAACLCVVVWASALAAGTFYAAPDGRRDDAQENLRLI